jgi:UDP-2,4-diacetamido-2,4,6-trideoxy-beta-L-altropyranose hydrolase
MNMRVAIRVDASTAMGLGHVKRCLSLGKALRVLGATVCYVTRPLGLDTAARLGAEGMAVLQLSVITMAPQEPQPNDPPYVAWGGVDPALDAQETSAILLGFGTHWDWIVVDSYALDARWHRSVRDIIGARICVIDDLANRSLDCDLLVDHNFAADHRAKYATRASSATRILGGPQFALLDPAYERAAKHQIKTEVRDIGIFMGGTDPWNASSFAVRACRGFAGFKGGIEIATTAANPHLSELLTLCENDRRLSVTIDAPDLTGFFARNDLQIGAGGGAVWERCCIGAPTIAMVLADNHHASLGALAIAGAVRLASSPNDTDLGADLMTLMSDASERARLSSRARDLVDGRGATRVGLAMLSSTLEFRAAVEEDALALLVWRNAEITRRHFRDPSPLSSETHTDWWRRSLDSPLRRLLVARCGTQDVGVLRLDLDSSGGQAELSLYLDPALHGLGLGTALLKAAQTWTLHNEPEIDRLVAEVLPGNKASHATFLSAGFKQAGTYHWNWTSLP